MVRGLSYSVAWSHSHFAPLKPPQVVCYEMKILTAWTLDQDHSILIGLLRKLLGTTMATRFTGELHVELSCRDYGTFRVTLTPTIT